VNNLKNEITVETAYTHQSQEDIALTHQDSEAKLASVEQVIANEGSDPQVSLKDTGIN
jgi:hypothetical protein